MSFTFTLSPQTQVEKEANIDGVAGSALCLSDSGPINSGALLNDEVLSPPRRAAAAAAATSCLLWWFVDVRTRGKRPDEGGAGLTSVLCVCCDLQLLCLREELRQGCHTDLCIFDYRDIHIDMLQIHPGPLITVIHPFIHPFRRAV